MDLDFDEGLYIFEITLGYQVGDSDHLTVPFTLKADDPDEAEEFVQEYLEIIQLSSKFWIAEILGPYDPEEYETLVDQGEKERWDRLEDHSEEDLLEILQSEDL
jgi:hypothetical protein